MGPWGQPTANLLSSSSRRQPLILLPPDLASAAAGAPPPPPRLPPPSHAAESATTTLLRPTTIPTAWPPCLPGRPPRSIAAGVGEERGGGGKHRHGVGEDGGEKEAAVDR
jgi:hypothetical protein